MNPEMAGDKNRNVFAKLNDGNYADWSMMMEACLVQKQLWEIVNKAKMRLIGSDNSAPVRAFVQKQAKACAKLMSTMLSCHIVNLSLTTHVITCISVIDFHLRFGTILILSPSPISLSLDFFHPLLFSIQTCLIYSLAR